ncbi:MAG: hypothetical protein F6K65_32015 [Moorea sp. SIO3C2]|nr:hypothetical protein [Moorena sp. SIO3C2]
MGTLNPGTVSFWTVISNNTHVYSKLAIKKFFSIPDSRTQLTTAILGGMGAYSIELAICLAYNSLGLCGRFLLSVSLSDATRGELNN